MNITFSIVWLFYNILERGERMIEQYVENKYNPICYEIYFNRTIGISIIKWQAWFLKLRFIHHIKDREFLHNICEE